MPNNNLTSSGQIEDVGQIDSEDDSPIRRKCCEPFPSKEYVAETARLILSINQGSHLSSHGAEEDCGGENASFFSNKGCFYSCLRFFSTLSGYPKSVEPECELSTEVNQALTI